MKHCICVARAIFRQSFRIERTCRVALQRACRRRPSTWAVWSCSNSTSRRTTRTTPSARWRSCASAASPTQVPPVMSSFSSPSLSRVSGNESRVCLTHKTPVTCNAFSASPAHFVCGVRELVLGMSALIKNRGRLCHRSLDVGRPFAVQVPRSSVFL